jgi:hypothetical protein
MTQLGATFVFGIKKIKYVHCSIMKIYIRSTCFATMRLFPRNQTHDGVDTHGCEWFGFEASFFLTGNLKYQPI